MKKTKSARHPMLAKGRVSGKKDFSQNPHMMGGKKMKGMPAKLDKARRKAFGLGK